VLLRPSLISSSPGQPAIAPTGLHHAVPYLSNRRPPPPCPTVADCWDPIHRNSTRWPTAPTRPPSPLPFLPPDRTPRQFPLLSPSLSTDTRESPPPSPFRVVLAAQAHTMSSLYQPKPIVLLMTGDPATTSESCGEAAAAAIAGEILSLCRSSPTHGFLTSSSPHPSCRSTLKPPSFTGVSLPPRKHHCAARLWHPDTAPLLR
jgi:hypothetical protein